MNKTPWQQKDWIEARNEVINEDSVCEICGSKEDLAPHHPYKETIRGHASIIKGNLLKEFEDTMFESKDPFIKALWEEYPPTHHSHLSHPYKHPIKQHHSIPTDESQLKYWPIAGFSKGIKDYKWRAFWEWLVANGKMDTWNGAHDAAVENYYSMKGVQILCKRCHYAIVMGKELCPRCKKRFMERTYEYCLACSKEVEKEEQLYEEEMHRQGYY